MPSIATLAGRNRPQKPTTDHTITNLLAAAPGNTKTHNAAVWLTRTQRAPLSSDTGAFSSFAAVGVLIPAVLVSVDRYPTVAIACMALSLVAASLWTVLASRHIDRARNLRDAVAHAYTTGVDVITIRNIIQYHANNPDRTCGLLMSEANSI